ncbi:hypothetical protein [Dyadobacter sp. CY323]|uniref:hypothetical protein n=1 Tax=Dyadobacter sp. CY323 TaxID=2907302 RepID=UPI001F1AC5E8|nr:hypothetical protein [Dyadobacter sp. CY323]MCE6989650.1 hypothetical protein [Dyadobacter sp. CY323]
MKKGIFITAMFLLTASGIAFSQATTISTNPRQKGTVDTTATSPTASGERKTTDGGGHQNTETRKTATQAGKATGAGVRNKPGGDSGESGKAATPAKTRSSTTNASKSGQAGDQGSATSADNSKNKTGKTGGKNNEQSKKSTGN